MNIKEIENASGMARASIRYYEKEGLIAPMRRENGYRDYSPRDLEELKKIRLLRELGLTLEQIREAQTAPERLPALLAECERAAEQEIGARRQAMAVCREIRSKELSYDALSPQTYLERLREPQESEAAGRQGMGQQETGQWRTGQQETGLRGTGQQETGLQGTGLQETGLRGTGQQETRLQETGQQGSRLQRADRARQEPQQEDIWRDTEPLTFYPWRRLLARGIDLSLCKLCVVLLWIGALGMPFSSNVFTDVFTGRRWAWAALILMLLTEPLFLATLGTTPGKWLSGIRVYREDGRKLAYREACRRTWQVIRQGLGFCIPLLKWYCMYQGWKRYTAEGRAEWDDETDYQVKEREDWISWLAGLAVAVFCMGGVYLTVMGRMLPPNRGELTVAEFAENYNYYVRRAARENGTYDERILAGLMLGEDGQFSLHYEGDESFLYSSGVAVQTSEEPDVEFIYLLEGETVKGISFVQSIPEYCVPSGYVNEMQCAALAYLAADERVVSWNGSMSRLLNALGSHIAAFQSYEFEERGSLVSCLVEFGEEGFQITFSIQ